MLLDCGLMFPDADMLGHRPRAPDFTWLRENADRIDGCIVTHGHEDHVGGLSFLLRELSFPIYGSALTLGLARNRIEEAGLLGRTELIPVVDGERRRIGPFDCEFIPVTHSVPHGFATAFHTPQGVILHSGDFKLDLTPVDGRLTDLARIGAHRLRARASGCCCPTPPTPTSRATRRARRASAGCCYDLFHEHEGRRIITACFASHIHRIQQIADAAIAFGRDGRHPRPVDEEERAAGPRDGPAAHPRRRRSSTSRTSATCAPAKVCVDLDGLAGRADVGAGAAWPPARTAG